VSTAVEREPTVESIGFLALAYFELATRWSSAGPRIDGSELFDDLEQGDPELSLLTLVASDVLAEADWRIVRWLGRDPVSLAEGFDCGLSADDFELAGCAFAEFRLEALLHAVAAGGQAERLDELGLPAEFLLRVMAPERWRAVEAAMERLRGLGLATTHEELDDVYYGAVRAATAGR